MGKVSRLLISLLGLWFCAAAQAQTLVRLPVGESEAEWAEALEGTDLAIGEGPAPIELVLRGERWLLRVRDQADQLHQVLLEAPLDAQGRRDLLLLAVSLRQPLVGERQDEIGRHGWRWVEHAELESEGEALGAIDARAAPQALVAAVVGEAPVELRENAAGLAPPVAWVATAESATGDLQTSSSEGARLGEGQAAGLGELEVAQAAGISPRQALEAGAGGAAGHVVSVGLAGRGQGETKSPHRDSTSGVDAAARFGSATEAAVPDPGSSRTAAGESASAPGGAALVADSEGATARDGGVASGDEPWESAGAQLALARKNTAPEEAAADKARRGVSGESAISERAAAEEGPAASARELQENAAGPTTPATWPASADKAAEDSQTSSSQGAAISEDRAAGSAELEGAQRAGPAAWLAVAGGAAWRTRYGATPQLRVRGGVCASRWLRLGLGASVSGAEDLGLERSFQQAGLEVGAELLLRSLGLGASLGISQRDFERDDFRERRHVPSAELALAFHQALPWDTELVPRLGVSRDLKPIEILEAGISEGFMQAWSLQLELALGWRAPGHRPFPPTQSAETAGAISLGGRQILPPLSEADTASPPHLRRLMSGAGLRTQP